MKKNKLLAAMLLAIAYSPLFAQVKVGDNPATINASAVLDIESATKGILFPRVALTSTTAFSPLSAHVAGMHVYNTATAGDVTPGNYANDGTQWVRIITELPPSTQIYGSGEPSGTCAAGTMYTDTLQSSSTAGRQWTCVGGTWTAYKAPESTPFYLSGTTNDAGASKFARIYRRSGIVLEHSDLQRSVTLTADGGIKLFRSNMASPSGVNGYLDFDKVLNGSSFRLAMRSGGAFTNDIFAIHAGNTPRLSVATTGKVGINTVNPLYTLHVSGNILGADDGFTGNLATGTASKNGFILMSDTAESGVSYAAIQNNDASGNLFLTKKTASTGDRFINFVTGAAGTVGSVTRSATGVAFNTTSDRRLKENIKATHFTIQDLMKINVTDYNFKADKNKTVTTGFIAQELYKIFPDAVTVGGDNVKENPWTVDYGKVTPLLVKAIQDQQKEIAALKAQLDEMNTLKAEVASIKQLLGKTDVVPATSLSK